MLAQAQKQKKSIDRPVKDSKYFNKTWAQKKEKKMQLKNLKIKSYVKQCSKRQMDSQERLYIRVRINNHMIGGLAWQHLAF